MKPLFIPLLLGSLVLSTGASAHGSYGRHGNQGGWDDERHGHDRYDYDRPSVYYRQSEPVVIIERAPVVYRERIVYRDRPMYDNRDYRHSEPHERSRDDDDQRLTGQVIGAIAGAALGNQVGRGNGRVAATAIGAVIGSAVGGNVARY